VEIQFIHIIKVGLGQHASQRLFFRRCWQVSWKQKRIGQIKRATLCLSQ